MERSARIYRFSGIIIRRTRYGEADRILTVFTREKGKITLLAKGVRRTRSRRSGHLEVFSHVTGIGISGRGPDILGEVSGQNYFPEDGLRLDEVSFAYYAAEIIDKILPYGEAHPEVYGEFAEFLARIRGEDQVRLQGLVESFAVTILRTLGYLPDTPYEGGDIELLLESVSERAMKSPKFIRKMKSVSG